MIASSVSIPTELQILSHPWYKKWECGEISREALQEYAKEYYHQVANFPRYLSRLHSQMETLEDRQLILKNLQDEENELEPHPELWLDFAEAMGVDRSEVQARAPGVAAQGLVNEFSAVVASGVPEGIGALIAYEAQVPQVAKFKRAALEQFYLAPEIAEKGTRFFTVHEAMDVEHTGDLEKLAAKFSPEEKQRAQGAGERVSAALMKFLDGMPE